MATTLKKAFTDSSGNINWKNVAAAAGGLYGLYQSNQPQQKTGYQGSIPRYQLVREQVPGATTDVERRPGSSGQRYFSTPTYATSDTAAAAKTAATEEAAGLAAINKASPVREKRAAESAATNKAVAASNASDAVTTGDRKSTRLNSSH